MLVVAVLLGDAFLRLWVGDVFANMAAELLMLLLVSYFLASMSVVASQIFNGIGNSRVGAFFSALGATTNVIACIVLIPRCGLSGAALASLLSMLQVFGYTHLLHRRLELPDFPFAGLWLRLLVVGFIQAGVLWFGQRWLAGWWSLAALACLGWAIFYLGWYVLRFADEGDRDVMHRLWLAATQRTRFD
jgi:O-antigen/teichoic acid export membrane protein